MRTLKFIDMTLRQAGPSFGKELSFKEKLEIARSLDRLKADTIELAPISGSRADQLANRTIASMAVTRISAAVDISVGNIEETWESVRPAKKPKLNIIAPVSPVQMEYVCHKKAPAMLALIEEKVKEARFYSEYVEFSAVDATRAETGFLYQALNTAIDAGANKITVADTAGVMMPDEFEAFIKGIMENVPGLAEIELYVEISDSLNMALACQQVHDGLRLVQIRVTELHRVVGQLRKIILPEETESSRFSNIALEDVANVCLDASDDISEVNRVVRQMGYDLSEQDKGKVYEAFMRVAEKKQFVGTKELDAIIASSAMQVPSTYHIKNYVINSGNVITATANVLLTRDGVDVRGVGIGDGPIDAAFSAIEQIVGHRYELDDFQIQTVTEGRDAMGSALVKLRAEGRVYSGNGISTDIIGASIRAYLSALNKIIYEDAN